MTRALAATGLLAWSSTWPRLSGATLTATAAIVAAVAVHLWRIEHAQDGYGEDDDEADDTPNTSPH